ncbi:hypothetical protein Ate02nite_54670 [Paractinoplanes tereljensis]|uniref:Uncharacterized protein n=2 Tax=Paractinoplanes tereljensis TaxID=571912 RepID=A0A919NSG0_9ACTN|nr:hypothetical protein Ate02nite_54670 [Actinoplanes tereljensis]
MGVILLVVGGLVGGLVTHRWQAHTSREADASVISVVALTDFGDRPGLVQSSAGVGSETTAVSLNAHVTIVNAGPMALDVLGFAVDQPGMVLLGYTAGRVGPAATMAVQLAFQIECAVSRGLLAVPASLSVETVAGDRRQITVTIGGNPWVRQVQAACASLAQRPGKTS